MWLPIQSPIQIHLVFLQLVPIVEALVTFGILVEFLQEIRLHLIPLHRQGLSIVLSPIQKQTQLPFLCLRLAPIVELCLINGKQVVGQMWVPIRHLSRPLLRVHIIAKSLILKPIIILFPLRQVQGVRFRINGNLMEAMLGLTQILMSLHLRELFTVH